MYAPCADKHLSAYLSLHMCTVLPRDSLKCNHCLTNETDTDCISIRTLVSRVVNEGCVFVHAERETPVSRREQRHIPHTKNDTSPFLLFFLFTHCVGEIKTKRENDITELDFKATIQTHVRVKDAG